MTPGFQRKVRRLAQRMNGRDPMVRLTVGAPTKNGDNQACTFDVTYKVGGKDRKYQYLLVDDPDACQVQVPATGTSVFELDSLDGVDAPERLLTELASRCLMEQIAEKLPGQLRQMKGKVTKLEIPVGEFTVEKGGGEYEYSVNVEIRDFREYEVTLDSEGDEWVIGIPLKDLNADGLIAQVINDPMLSSGWVAQRQAVLENLLTRFRDAGLEAELGPDLKVELGCESSATIEIKRSAENKFELTLENPTAMYTDSEEFDNLGKLTEVLKGLTPNKIKSELGKKRRERLKPAPEQQCMDSALNLV